MEPAYRRRAMGIAVAPVCAIATPDPTAAAKSSQRQRLLRGFWARAAAANSRLASQTVNGRQKQVVQTVSQSGLPHGDSALPCRWPVAIETLSSVVARMLEAPPETALTRPHPCYIVSVRSARDELSERRAIRATRLYADRVTGGQGAESSTAAGGRETSCCAL